MNVPKGVLIAVGAIVLLLFLVAGVGFYLLSQPAEIGAVLASSRPDQDPGERYNLFGEEIVEDVTLVVTDEDGSKLIEFATTVRDMPVKTRVTKYDFTEDRVLAVVETEISGIKTAMPEGVTLEATEEDGSKQIWFAGEFRGMPVKIRVTELEFVQDKVLAVMEADVSGFEATVALGVRIEVEEGKPKITTEEIKIGRLPVPKPIRDMLGDMINKKLESLAPDLPLKLKDVQIREGQLIVQAESP
ncbi:hypothetical protein ACFLVX_00420 [Chloroflexota bacterium]